MASICSGNSSPRVCGVLDMVLLSLCGSGPASGLFDACDLIGVKLVCPPDRDIFTKAEAFFAQAETDLVVSVTLLIIEIPLAAGLAPQPADPDCFAFLEIPDATGSLDFFHS